MDVERIAFVARVKPAVRIRIERERAPKLVAELEGLGAEVRRGPWRMPGGPPRDVVCAAWTARAVEELAHGEWELCGRDRGDDNSTEQAEAARVIGRCLGYPPCCVESFAERARVKVERSRFSTDWLAVQAAWVRRPRARLDTLRFGERLHLISFEPCRFDCPAALEVADAIAAAVAREDPDGLRRLDEALRTSIAIEPSGERARVVLRSRIVEHAAAIPRHAGRPPSEGSESLAGRIVGRAVAETGELEGDSARVVDFATDVPPGGVSARGT